VGAHGSSKLIVAADDLENTRRKNLLCELNELERSVRRKGRRLDNDGVASHERWSDLADAENQGKVPWADGFLGQLSTFAR
jgi:hypothetical protein